MGIYAQIDLRNSGFPCSMRMTLHSPWFASFGSWKAAYSLKLFAILTYVQGTSLATRSLPPCG
jgi:hypothetical protein